MAAEDRHRKPHPSSLGTQAVLVAFRRATVFAHGSAWCRGRRVEENRWHGSIRPAPPVDRGPQSRRNAIEPGYRALRDLRRIATRYEKLARNLLAYWIRAN
jgi:hypothetical protein